jgi:hypothetical protein
MSITDTPLARVDRLPYPLLENQRSGCDAPIWARITPDKSAWRRQWAESRQDDRKRPTRRLVLEVLPIAWRSRDTGCAGDCNDIIDVWRALRYDASMKR